VIDDVLPQEPAGKIAAGRAFETDVSATRAASDGTPLAAASR
jgi:hypothetical protein